MGCPRDIRVGESLANVQWCRQVCLRQQYREEDAFLYSSFVEVNFSLGLTLLQLGPCDSKKYFGGGTSLHNRSQSDYYEYCIINTYVYLINIYKRCNHTIIKSIVPSRWRKFLRQYFSSSTRGIGPWKIFIITAQASYERRYLIAAVHARNY